MIYEKNVHFVIQIKLSKKVSSLAAKGIFAKIAINNFKINTGNLNYRKNFGMNMSTASKPLKNWGISTVNLDNGFRLN